MDNIIELLGDRLPKNAPKQVTPALYFGQLFQSRDVMHLVHLNSRSYAEHMALNNYYDTLLYLIDNLIESYQGTLTNGGRVNIIIPSSEYITPDQHLTSLEQYLEAHRVTVFGNKTSLQNIVDEIVALIQKTKYLLSLS